MKVWKKILLIFVIIIVFIFDIIISRFLMTNNGRGIYFVSLRPGFSWNVDKNTLAVYEQQVSNVLGSTPRVLIVLSPYLKKTRYATGFDENAVYYGEEATRWGWHIVTIYVDKAEFQKYPAKRRNGLLGVFVEREINKILGIEKSQPTVNEPLLSI